MNCYRLFSKGLLLILFYGISLNILFAQESSKNNSFDLGINITSVLSSFSGNGTFINASDFPLSIRIRKNNKILRIGLGLTGSTNESFDNISLSFRESSEQKAFGRLGFEVNAPIDKKWTFYWGMDGLASYELDKSQIFNSSPSTISKRIIGVGGGVLTGIKFEISEHLYLSSEATMYFVQNFRRQTETGVFSTVINTQSQEFALLPPLFVYLNYSF